MNTAQSGITIKHARCCSGVSAASSGPLSRYSATPLEFLAGENLYF